VSPSNPEVLVDVLGLPGAELDMMAEIPSGDFVERLSEHLDDDAAIGFLTPDGGHMGEMGASFTGIEGFLAGWREWLAPWEEMRTRNVAVEEGEEGKFAALSLSHVTMRGSGVQLEQETALVLTLNDGRIRSIDHFLDHEQARRAAGGPPPAR
jgi:hypothetical protein